MRKSDGRWMARVPLPGRNENGKRRRKTVYGGTRGAVAQKLNKLLGRSASGQLLVTTTPTVASWLNTWYATHVREWNGTTPAVYRHAVDSWIVPTLGAIRLEALTANDVQNWVNGENKDGARAYVLTAIAVLGDALRDAMKKDLVSKNTAELADVPRPEKAPINPLTPEEVIRLLAVAPAHRLGALVVTALGCGLRIGEATGLTWALLDLDTNTAHITQQLQPVRATDAPMSLKLVPLKTKASRRSLVLPSLAVELLQTHRRQQLEERLKAGAEWSNGPDLVFTTPAGAPLWPGTVRRAFRAMLKDAKIPSRKFHILRHSTATLLLANGAQLVDVSKALGHASIHVTADIYAHFVPMIAATVASRMDTAMKTGTKP
jgi:integrase